MAQIRIITIGASAGGFNALAELAARFTPDMNAAVFIVLHLSKKAVGEVLVNFLQKTTKLRCKLAEDNEDIEPGVIYIAKPDYHLLIKETKIRVTQGAHENLWRPSIDVMMRSAAASHGPNAIGIILTGMLDDGVSGMAAIKKSGGICIVQDPNQAEFPDMPLNVLNSVEVDHSAHLADMGYIIKDVLSKKPLENHVPSEIKNEAEIIEEMEIGIDKVKKIGGKPTVFACPDCGGMLMEITEGKRRRFRCYTGHAFSEEALIEKQNEALEESLWISVRIMEERKNLLKLFAEAEQGKGLLKSAENNLHNIEEIDVHINRLKEVLLRSRKNMEHN
jgi:two-component system, chemotaxis family, protein-glutamate methylesterase/glutaminase